MILATLTGVGPLREKLKFLLKPLVFLFAFLALSFSCTISASSTFS